MSHQIPTVAEAIRAFAEFTKLFSEEERKRVFNSEEYKAFCLRNMWVATAKDNELLR